jgi:hypothetical protein
MVRKGNEVRFGLEMMLSYHSNLDPLGAVGFDRETRSAQHPKTEQAAAASRARAPCGLAPTGWAWAAGDGELDPRLARLRISVCF